MTGELHPQTVGLRVNLLLVFANYPHPAAEWVGAPNEHSTLALQKSVRNLEVLAPRPYAPRWLSINDRWKAYARIPNGNVRRGIRIHRPAFPVVPKILQAFWPSRAAFWFSRRLVRKRHLEVGFDAILSFDLALTGELAWRLGRDLGIPACGWATGSDIRANAHSGAGRSVRGALQKLDMVFYQSNELKALGAELLATIPDALPPEKHIVQPRGIIGPEALPGEEVRHAVRSSLGLSEDQIVILYLGRIVRGKGLFELVDRFVHCAKERPDLALLLVGSRPGYDDMPELHQKIRSLHAMDGRIQILPGCPPGQIWEYFRAADMFAFPSFREGMPNALLEAMVAGLPAIAFSIPAVQEITRFGRGLVEVRAHDFLGFGEAILALARDPSLRREIGEGGRSIVRAHFSQHKSMRAVIEHIQKLTASRANARMPAMQDPTPR